MLGFVLHSSSTLCLVQFCFEQTRLVVQLRPGFATRVASTGNVMRWCNITIIRWPRGCDIDPGTTRTTWSPERKIADAPYTMLELESPPSPPSFVGRLCTASASSRMQRVPRYNVCTSQPNRLLSVLGTLPFLCWSRSMIHGRVYFPVFWYGFCALFLPGMTRQCPLHQLLTLTPKNTR